MLEGQARAGRHRFDQLANRVEPLDARGDRHARLVAVDLGHQSLPAVVADVRQVRDHQVVVARRHAVHNLHLERQPEPRGVFARDLHGFGRHLRCAHLQVRALVEQGQCDCARTGAHVVHARPLGEVERGLHEQLALRARDHHSTIHHELDVAESLAPDDVGHRLALVAPPDVLGDHAGSRRRDLHVGIEEKPLARDVHRVGDQQLSVELRRGAAGRAESGRGGLDGLPDDQLLTVSAASSIRRFSSDSSAAVKSSSSPPSTPGRLPFVRPTRWSVTRSCGKL